MNNNIGLLWFNAKGFDEDKAIAAYQRRMKKPPNTVQSRSPIECKKLTVVLTDRLPKDHYFLTQEPENVKT